MDALRIGPRTQVAFRAASITKLYGETVALWDIGLDGRSGELVGVHGANGSGKSTLLRIIAGLTTPTRGRVSWTMSPPGARPRIGLLGHATHLFDELTGIENVLLAARLARYDGASAADLLYSLGVADHSGRPARELSAGTRRRVGLARVLATNPDVLLIDEPYAGLDKAAAGAVTEILADSMDQGRIVVVATHDDARTRSLASRVVRLEHGRAAVSGPVGAFGR